MGNFDDLGVHEKPRTSPSHTVFVITNNRQRLNRIGSWIEQSGWVDGVQGLVSGERERLVSQVIGMVGVVRLELTTPCSQSTCGCK